MENGKFYIIYLIDSDCETKDGKRLESGYYRYIYDLGGSDSIEHCCQFSSDRYKWEDCGLFSSIGEFQDTFRDMKPEPLRIENEDYVETIHYRGYSVPIFSDDYGQCFYCIINNKILSFGSFQPEYEDEVRTLIDKIIEKGK